jgi:hypothetical protein
MDTDATVHSAKDASKVLIIALLGNLHLHAGSLTQPVNDTGHDINAGFLLPAILQ